MKNVYLIAIAGGIASGKSLALGIAKKHGFFVLSCDEIISELYKKRSFLIKLKKLFPKSVSVIKKQVNRKEIAAAIFSSDALRQKLNKLTHPIVIKTAIMAAIKSASDKAVIEVPVLFEGGYEGLFDKVIIITRDKEERLNALSSRGHTLEEAEKRISSQIDYDKIDKTKYLVIANDGTEKDLEEKLLKHLN